MEVLRDYSIRGRELEGMNLFDFMLNTYEGTHRRHTGSNTVFVHYLPGSHKQDKGRIVRSSHEEVVPEMFGGWPPALDDCEDGGLYEACMLLLFNPWRNVRRLKNGHESFGAAFAGFEQAMSDEVRERIDHIQSYHQCGWGGLESVFEGDNWFNDL